MAFPEYREAWKFLSLPGKDADIKKYGKFHFVTFQFCVRAFDSVDVDSSGLVDWLEFVFSIMGEKAQNYGILAGKLIETFRTKFSFSFLDMEELSSLLAETLGNYGGMAEELAEARMSTEDRAERNKKLRDRLESMKSEVSGQMNALFESLTGVNPEDVLSEEEIRGHLEGAFNKFDENKNGRLDKWEFMQAWFFVSH